MKLTSFITEIRGRFALAALAGLLLALAYPKPGLGGLAWFAPGLLLFSALGLRGGPAFRVGCVAGLTTQLVALRWLLHIPFPAGAISGWLVLSAYLSLFTGAWVWLASRLVAQAFRSEGSGEAPTEFKIQNSELEMGGRPRSKATPRCRGSGARCSRSTPRRCGWRSKWRRHDCSAASRGTCSAWPSGETRR